MRKKRTRRVPGKPAPSGEIEKANARFDRLLEAMAKTPALPKKKRRVRTRDESAQKFDD